MQSRMRKRRTRPSAKRSRVLHCLVALVFFIIAGIVFFSSRKRDRIAIIIPFLSKSLTMLPPYLPVFLRTANGSSSLVDFLIMHNGQLNSFIDESGEKSTIQGFDIPDNVKFIDLKSMENMASYFLRVVDKRLEGNGSAKDQLHKMLSVLLHSNPYALVEFKPAFGHIFQEYIEPYSHWGYSDFDIAFGDLPQWITKDELKNYDIVTYGYGDQHRVYLRGQFTFHKNLEHINNIWRKCSYLSNMDTRFAAVVAKKEKIRLESAEGCYSQAAITTDDIRIKYAVKAFTDVKEYNDDTFEFGMAIGTGLHQQKSVLYKIGEGSDAVGQFLRMDGNWWSGRVPYGTKDLQRESGDLISINDSKKGPGCMFWVRGDYQSDLCYEGVENTDTVFLIDGHLYKQRFEEMPLQGGVKSRALFHFQEWKRTYRTSQLLAFGKYHSWQRFKTQTGWYLFPEGAVPMLTELSSKVRSFPVGEDPGILPPSLFCLAASGKKNHLSPVCDYAVSWNDKSVYTLMSDDWVDAKKNGITLVLTLRLHGINDDNDHLLLDVLETNFMTWVNNPVIVLVHVSVFEERSTTVLNHLKQMSEKRSLFLFGIIENVDDHRYSRNGLLNMAEAASRTRWTIVGVDVERGQLLSRESSFFAKRAASISGTKTGNVFIVPQMAAIDYIDSLPSNESQSNNARFSSLLVSGLLKEYASRTGNIATDLMSFDCNHCGASRKEQATEKAIHRMWLNLSKNEIFETPPMADWSVVGESKVNLQAQALNDLQNQLSSLLLEEHHKELFHMDKHPILMIDTMGPLPSMSTPHLLSEIVELPDSCTNGLRLVQLAALDYRIQPLVGAFTISFPDSRPICFEYATEDCEVCNTEGVGKIIKEEGSRVAKFAAVMEAKGGRSWEDSR